MMTVTLVPVNAGQKTYGPYRVLRLSYTNGFLHAILENDGPLWIQTDGRYALQCEEEVTEAKEVVA